MNKKTRRFRWLVIIAVLLAVVWIFPIRPYIIVDPEKAIDSVISKQTLFMLSERYDAGLGPFDFPVVLCDRIDEHTAIVRMIGIYGASSVRCKTSSVDDALDLSIDYLSPGDEAVYSCWWNS